MAKLIGSAPNQISTNGDLGKMAFEDKVSVANINATWTKDSTTFLRGDNTFAEVPAGGITEADQWRLTVTKTDNTDITANLERVDDASFGYIGTGMTESSGIFTFPSTGIYQISTTFKGYSSNTSDTMKILTYASIDSGSTYDQISETSLSSTTSANLGDTATSHVFVDVTNTSTVKVKFAGSSLSAGSNIEGNTDTNQTHFTFIRLGDT